MAERVALVTGCSSGFGLGVVQALEARGWAVTATVRDPARAPAALRAARIVALDLADDGQIDALAARFERLDCLVNNAGYALNGPFATYSAAQMRRQLDINFTGAALLIQRLLPALAAARGRVINLSSLAGENGLPMNALYSASKFALEGLTEALRHELAPHGVQVAMVEPGGFRTRFLDNMEWGERPMAPDGVDARWLEAYRGMQGRLRANAGKDPQAVVDAIVALTERRTMPLRTRVGIDAHALHALKRLLPARAFDRVVASLIRRAFGMAPRA